MRVSQMLKKKAEQDVIPFGEYSLPLVKRFLPASKLNEWLKPKSMMAMIGFLQKNGVDQQDVRKVKDL
jgi:hypothetical protein